MEIINDFFKFVSECNVKVSATKKQIFNKVFLKNTNMQGFYDRVRYYTKLKKLSIVSVCEQSGMTYQGFRDAEKRNASPKQTTIEKFAETLGVGYGDLVSNEDLQDMERSQMANYYHKIKSLAKIKGLNLTEIAEQVGMSESGLYAAFRNDTLRVPTLIDIAKILDVSIVDLLSDDEEVGQRMNLFQKKIHALESEKTELRQLAMELSLKLGIPVASKRKRVNHKSGVYPTLFGCNGLARIYAMC